MKTTAKGYSLIEVMIALMIFSGAMITILALFPISLRDAYRAKIMTQAAFLCQAKMEEILSVPGTMAPPESDRSGRFEPEFPDFTYVARKYPYVYYVNGRRITSLALSEIHVAVFHPINNRRSPLVEHFTIKSGIGEQKGF